MLHEEGWLVASVERQKKFPKRNKDKTKIPPCAVCGQQEMIEIKEDLWNCFDLICEHPQKQERMYVQVTAGTHHTDRKKKILASFEAKLVLLAGAKIRIHTWNKDDAIDRWVVRDEEITLKDFRQAFAYPNTVKDMLEIRRKAKAPDLPPGSTLQFCPLKDTEEVF